MFICVNVSRRKHVFMIEACYENADAILRRPVLVEEGQVRCVAVGLHGKLRRVCLWLLCMFVLC